MTLYVIVSFSSYLIYHIGLYYTQTTHLFLPQYLKEEKNPVSVT